MYKKFIYIIILTFLIFNLNFAQTLPIDSEVINNNTQTKIFKECVVGGCNSELCGESGDYLASICLYDPEYSCFKYAKCERQSNGKCDWTITLKSSICFKKVRFFKAIQNFFLILIEKLFGIN